MINLVVVFPTAAVDITPLRSPGTRLLFPGNFTLLLSLRPGMYSFLTIAETWNRCCGYVMNIQIAFFLSREFAIDLGRLMSLKQPQKLWNFCITWEDSILQKLNYYKTLGCILQPLQYDPSSCRPLTTPFT